MRMRMLTTRHPGRGLLLLALLVAVVALVVAAAAAPTTTAATKRAPPRRSTATAAARGAARRTRPAAGGRAAQRRLGHADQDRDHVGVQGRVRLVRQAEHGGRRVGDLAVRRRHAEGHERPEGRASPAARSATTRSSSSAWAAATTAADTAIKETRRLMEQLDADVMIGPLSGDESIAVANYAKQHPDKTFVDGSAGAQDTTLKVQAPNFFRFNGDGAQWNAGLGDIAYNKLGWKKAAVVADDYSFAWTSAAGFIAEFCAAGGQITKRVFPPLNTTDYSSLRAADADRRGRHVRRRRRRGPDPVPEGLRAGQGPDRRQEVHRQPVLGHAGAVRAARAARRGRLHRRRRHGGRPRHAGGAGLREQHHRQVVQASSRRAATRRRRRRARSRTATT